MNWKEASKSSTGYILTRKNFMPMMRLMMLWTTKGLCSFCRSSFSSVMNFFLTAWNLSTRTKIEIYFSKIPLKLISRSKEVEPTWRKLSYFDCVRTPMTSAYRSAMMCTLPVLGPQYLSVKNRFWQWKQEGVSCQDCRSTNARLTIRKYR